MKLSAARRLLLTAVCLLPAARCLLAEEGMWLFNQFPKQQVEKAYGFSVTDAFLDHLRLASVRFNSGGSGSFVSSDGLLFTNHHIASDCIQKLGTAQADYMTDGFYAATAEQEKKCPDLELNILLRIEDVTAKVNAGIDPQAAAAEANKLRKAAISRLEKECSPTGANRCDVVTLYSGGQYHLYEYRKYTDIRLVFAPEMDAAFFGGDPDNFTYPRYCLDIAFLRAWENGKPAQVREHLRWSRQGVKDGELIFVSGHPGSSGRLRTVAQLEFSRDHAYPLVIPRLESMIRALKAYGVKSEENRRVAKDTLFSAENSYKAIFGYWQGLKDPQLMGRKRDDEQTLRAAIAANPEWRKQFGGVWDEVAAAYKEYQGLYKPYTLLEANAFTYSDLFLIARRVLRLAEERAKPNDQRLPEYADARLPSLELALYSPAPITDSLEVAILAETLDFMRQRLGAGDPAVRALLDGKTPEQAAEHYVSTSKLKDVEERKRLAASLDAVRNSEDGMLRLVRLLDEPARAVRKRYEDQVEAVISTSGARVAQARYAVRGAGEYPDATFTLRLTYAPVKGFRDENGKPVPYATDFSGLYRRATGKEPYRLPKRWLDSKKALELRTPFNFVTTADIHGGNSGSPTVNTRGEVVGILFDSNLPALPNQFVYTDQRARAVHVASQGIIEALRKVYRAERVLKELGQ